MPTFHRGIVNQTFDELESDSQLRNTRTSCLRGNEAVVIDFDDGGLSLHYGWFAEDGLLILFQCTFLPYTHVCVCACRFLFCN